MSYSLKFALLAVSSLTFAPAVNACTMLPMTPTPPSPWFVDNGPVTGTDRENIAVGYQLTGLFGPTTVTFCQCGTTFINGNIPVPPNVTDAYVTVTNIVTHVNTSRVTAFDQALSTPNTGVVSALNAISPSPNWAGFGGNVSPFTIPTLGTNEVFKLWFDYEVPISQVSSFINSSTFAVGAGSNTSEHPLVVQPIPEPGTASMVTLTGVGLLVAVLARSRRRMPKLI